MEMRMPGTNDGLSPEWIDRHNRRVSAFWTKMRPLIEAITEGQAAAIVELGMNRGRSMVEIAQQMRGRLDFEIQADDELAIGQALYVRALTMLDLYDDDFRPPPGRVSMGAVGRGELFHHRQTGEYEVVVDGLSERFRQTNSPRFGIDMLDHAKAEELAAALGGGEVGPK